ncbi:MAG: glycosyltransferase, partial [Thermodesulfobacteriota bacterium]|nr:glycosyltransferase [Thermodesulfobacteriota bacterium]
WINYKKNPQMILYLADILNKKSMDYTFHIIGKFQDPRYELYLSDMINKLGLSKTVFFEGWVDNKDLPKWFADKGYILSTSLFESFGNSIVEGVASGLLPLIHNFYGADKRFGEVATFNGTDDFVTLLKHYENLEDKRKQQISIAKRKAMERYNINRQLKKLNHIIEGLEQI